MSVKRVTPAYREGYGIMNPYGGMWTPDLFESEGKALRHLHEFWGKDEAKIAGFKIVLARQRTSFVSHMSTDLGRAALAQEQKDG